MTVKGKTSNHQKATTGVPQGSVRHPLLFILFINDKNKSISVICRLNISFLLKNVPKPMVTLKKEIDKV